MTTEAHEKSKAVASAVKEMPAEEVAQLRSALEQNMQPYATENGISLPGLTTNVVVS